ncbi:MAG TPA: hypothetical protein VNZ48_18380 [Xanthobacteraceae bacterium]|nr:hypothetical protein [Xanthobacteraceae bacterium]
MFKGIHTIERPRIGLRARNEHADAAHPLGLLRARREWPSE